MILTSEVSGLREILQNNVQTMNDYDAMPQYGSGLAQMTDGNYTCGHNE